MYYPSRKLHLVQPYMLDTAMRGRILNGCWLLAAAGISIVQMRLLAQAWHQNQHAVPTACVASAWLIGALLGGIVNNALRRGSAPPAIIWGTAFLGSALAWQTGVPAISHASAFPWMPDLVARTLPLMGMALLLGLLSALWLGQQRRWAAVGERAPLFRNAACPTFGLVLVWCSPNGSDLVGLVCLLPLLSLDLFTPSSNPRISWSGMTGTLLTQRADPACWLPLRLERPRRMAMWWRIPSREIVPAGRIFPHFLPLHGRSRTSYPVAFMCVLGKVLIFVVGRVRFLVKSAFLLAVCLRDWKSSLSI